MLSSVSRSIKEHLFLAVALLLALVIYYKFLFFGHISWDDPEMVFKNKAVRSFDIKAFFTDHYVGNYIPITMVAHAINWVLFDTSDGGHHAVNILLHMLNGILVYQLGKRLFKNDVIANIGAAVFLLHPLQVESVAWIAELKNVLSSNFYLAGLLSYLHYIEKGNKKQYLLSFLFFVLGCLSKSSVVILPLSLLCLDIFHHQKISFRFLINKIPFLLVSVLFGIINIKTQTADQFINHSHEFVYYQRFGFAGFALLKYLVLFLFPVNLSVIYPYPEIKATVFGIGLVVLVLLITLIIYFIRRKKYAWLICVLFILINLVLVLQFLPFGEVLYADRYLYIPIIGFAWMLGMIVSNIKVYTGAFTFILMLVFTLLSFGRADAWKSAIVLYEDIIKKFPDEFVALNSAGVESMFLNEDSKALIYFNKAVDAAPNNYKSYYNRGLLHLKNKRPSAAIKSFNQSLALYDYQKAYVGRASAYYMSGDIPKAMNDANRAILFEKENPRAHFVLGNCYNDLNKLDEAMKEYNKSIELNGEEADFYFKRAIVFGKKQDFISCLNDLVTCLSLNPNYYEAYYWKGVAKVNLNQDPCEDLRKAAQRYYEPAVKAMEKYCNR